MNTTLPGTSTVPAKVIRTSPMASGTGLRSIATSPPARCVDGGARAVIVFLGDAGHGIRHVEVHHHQRWRQSIDAHIAGFGELRGGRLHAGRSGTSADADAGPGAQSVVALAL